MRKSIKRLVIFGVPALVIIALVVVILGDGNGDGTEVQADLAVADDISEIVSASGRIQPQTKVDITAEVSAEIIAVFANEGDRVTHGQLLLLLDTVQYKSDVQQAEYSRDETVARTDAARSSFERDRLEFERQQRLHEQDLASETDFTNARFTCENSRANYEAMKAQVKTAQARLDKAQDNLTKTSIRAPMDGVITYLSAEAGEIAQAQTAFTQGRTLMTVADLSVFEVEVEIDESEIAKVALDQPARITVDAYRDTVFEGTVVEIGNSAIVKNEGTDDYSTNFRVKLRLEELEQAVRPGMSATVDITTAVEDDALLVPYASVVTREVEEDTLAVTEEAASEEQQGAVDGIMASSNGGDGAQATQAVAREEATEASGESETPKKKVKKSGVFVVRDGLAKFQEITTGIADDRNIVALTGLTPGDTVVSGSFQTLRSLSDGDPVFIEEASINRMNEDND